MSDNFSTLQVGQELYRNMPGGIKFKVTVTEITDTEIVISKVLRFDKVTGKEVFITKGLTFLSLT